VRGTLAALGLAVPEVVCGDEVARGKPHPAIYWELANRLDVAPAERARVLVFEDSEPGLKAARAAGMIPVGITSEADDATLRGFGAVATFATLADALPGALEALLRL
jgi:beta-phosphoglucomutase